MRIKTAFTILEMSIVLSVIGIIAGSLIIGNRLIERAKLDSAIADIERFRQATDKFETKYGSLPGDFAMATTYLTANSYTLLNGNGNGIIDTAYGAIASTESRQYFLHLSSAGLIAGNFDGSCNPGGPGLQGGFPQSLLVSKGNTSIFVPYNDTSLGLAYAAGWYYNTFNFCTTPNIWNAGTQMPSQSYYVDSKFDDANPDTGSVRAYDGIGWSVGDCRTTNQYNNLSTTGGSCLTVFAHSKAAVNTGASAAAVTCNGAPIGTTRVSTSTVCPDGTTGTVLEICNSSGAWVDNYRRTCESTKCGGGRTVGDTFVFSIDALYGGTYAAYCLTGGVYTANAYAAYLYTFACTGGTGVQPIYSQKAVGGGILLNCTAGSLVLNNVNGNVDYWVSDGVGPMFVGYVSTVAYAMTLPTSYYSCTKATKVSILPLTNVGGATFRPAYTDCKPLYTGACTAGDTRPIGCPPTQSGVHTQVCLQSGSWQTTLNTCAPVTCGGEPIGSWRIAMDMNCGQVSSYSIGTPYEICDYTAAALANSPNTDNGANPQFNAAQWQISTAHCM